MSLAEELLQLARQLVNNRQKELRDARLRRAISTAYYSLFHLLVQTASERFVTEDRLRCLVGRAFGHADMLRVARSFESGAGALPAFLTATFTGSIPAEIQQVAEAFADLQQARHEADYDLLKSFTRADAQKIVSQAEQAFATWNTVKCDAAAKPALELFLASLLLWERWKK
jgi:uncharacterized protein (UPF0332 family)